MIKLTPKATRFIGVAVNQMADREIESIWASVKHEPGTELPDRVARAVLAALCHFERELRARLDRASHDEDKTSDLSNDLGFVCAIEKDLKQQVGARW